MAWTEHGTLVGGVDKLTHTKLNELNANIEYLRAPLSSWSFIETAAISTTSTTFVDMGSSYSVNLDVTGSGAVVIAKLQGVVINATASNVAYFDVSIDGVRFGNATVGMAAVGSMTSGGITPRRTINVVCIITGLSAGIHAIKFQWKSSSGSSISFAAGGWGSVFVREL